MAAEAKLFDIEKTMVERDMMAHEMDQMYKHLREQFKNTEKLSIDQQKIIENLEEEL